MKRKLTDTEKRICDKMIKKLLHKKQHSEYLIKYTDLMINEGLFRNYQAKLDEFKQNKKELCTEMQGINLNIAELRDQVLNGVIVKKDKTEKKAPIGIG